MLRNFKYKLKKNLEIFGLICLIIITAFLTVYFNHKKNNEIKIFYNAIDNVYFLKTLDYLVKNLDPKFNKIIHKIDSGETFDKILESYSIDKEEIIKSKSLQKINLNKLNLNRLFNSI